MGVGVGWSLKILPNKTNLIPFAHKKINVPLIGRGTEEQEAPLLLGSPVLDLWSRVVTTVKSRCGFASGGKNLIHPTLSCPPAGDELSRKILSIEHHSGCLSGHRWDCLQSKYSTT